MQEVFSLGWPHPELVLQNHALAPSTVFPTAFSGSRCDSFACYRFALFQSSHAHEIFKIGCFSYFSKSGIYFPIPSIGFFDSEKFLVIHLC